MSLWPQHHSSLWRLVRLADRTLAHRYAHGEWWYLNAAILDMIREDCRKANVPVLFIYIPSREWGAFPSMRAYMASHQANFIDLSQLRRRTLTVEPNDDVGRMKGSEKLV
jgi:hypothetical protein